MYLQRIVSSRLAGFLLFALVATALATPASAADPVAGKALYLSANGAPLSCASSACHGADVARNNSNILSGSNNPAAIQRAISNDKGGMGFLSSYVNTIDIENIAAYIGNPTAGNGAPVISLSTNTLVFGNQVTGANSQPMTATVSNTGSVALTLGMISVNGTNAAEFARAGTCVPAAMVPAGSSCTIAATFSPQAAGTRSAAITITHNAAGGTSVIALSGTGALPQPAISLSGQTINFVAAQLLNTASASQSITLSNSGSAPLTFANLSLTGAHPGDFVRAGSCAVGILVSVGANCTLSVAFRPTVAGARTAQLVVNSNAPGSPHSISVAGNGTTIIAPLAQLSATALALGNEIVGSPTASKSVTLTNVGSSIFNISNITASPADFTYQSACGASVAAGASCTVPVTFTPTTTGARSGTLSIASDAPGSPHVVQLSGFGFAAGTLSAVTVNPESVSFGAQSVNTASAAQTVTLTNLGPVPIAITNFNLTGANFREYSRAGGTCADNVQIAETQTCTMTITFTPTAAGSRTATIGIASADISGNQSVSLSGTGVAPASSGTASTSNFGVSGGGGGGLTSTNIGVGGCTLGAASDPLLPLLILGALAGLARRRLPTTLHLA